MEINTQPQTNTSLAAIENLLRSRPVILQLLKFGAIGVINAALDFLVFNVVSKELGIDKGTRLGLVNIFSFTLANIQSYYWNKSWAFGNTEVGMMKNFFRLMAIGLLGASGVLLALIGASMEAVSAYYLFVLTGFIIVELIIWHRFGLAAGQTTPKSNFALFFSVSLVGMAINAGCVALFSTWLSVYTETLGNPDTVKNVAKIIATLVSLVWNFVGYKLIVFRK